MLSDLNFPREPPFSVNRGCPIEATRSAGVCGVSVFFQMDGMLDWPSNIGSEAVYGRRNKRTITSSWDAHEPCTSRKNIVRGSTCHFLLPWLHLVVA